jgi:hypothetical protein
VTTTILRDDTFDPSKHELAIAFSDAADLGDFELRRIFPIQDAKLERLGDSLYPEGFVIDGLAPSVSSVTNELLFSNTFASWLPHNNATVTPAYAPDRYGTAGRASRLVGFTGLDAYIEQAVAGTPTGRKLFSIDVHADASGLARLSIFDGIAEIAHADVVPLAGWTRFLVACDNAWSLGATSLSVRLRPGVLPQSGTILVCAAQVEDIAPGAPLVPGVYQETTTAAVTGPGNTVTLTAGHVYAHGLPRALPQAVMAFDPLKAAGQDLIYCEVAERYVLAIVDPTLENPYTGRAGNDSVREEVQLTKLDTTNPAVAADAVVTNPQYRARFAVAMYQFDRATGLVSPVIAASHIDLARTVGQLDGKRIAPQSLPEDRLDLKATEGQPGLLAAQARRMRNASGNYVQTKSGQPPKLVQDLTVVNQVQAKLDPLDGYTLGFSHYLDDPAIVTTPLQVTTNLRTHEPFPFYAGTATYKLGRAPIVGIAQLIGIFELTENVTRGVPGGADALGNQPVFEIVSITQGAATYTPGPTGDYVQVGDTVDWGHSVVTGHAPAQGTSYLARYRYSRAWPASEYTHDATHVTFTGANRPVDTLPVYIDYNYGQDRTDLLILGQNGLAVLPGTPADHPVPPQLPAGALALFEVAVPYQATAAAFKAVFTFGVPMAQLAGIQAKLDILGYNFAQLAATVNLQKRNATLKDAITDPLIDGRQFDTLASYLATPGINTARIDPTLGGLRMARDTTPRAMMVDANPLHTTFQLVGGTFASLPFIATPAIVQDLYTQDASVNPFNNADPIPPLITISTQQWYVQNWYYWWWWYGYAYYQLQTRITVTGDHYAPNELVTLYADNVAIGTVMTNAGGTFTFDQSGSWDQNTIISAIGGAESARGVTGTSQKWPRVDPLAETFTLVEDGMITGLKLFFTAKDLTKSVTITLRNTIAGLPIDTYLARVTLTPAQVNVDGTATHITLPVPLPVSADTALAVIAASDSSAYRLQLAQTGKANLGPAGGVVASNPYGAGVLLESSDGRVWSAFQDSDLRFTIETAAFTKNALYALLLQPVVFGAGVTSFRMKPVQLVSEGATVAWYYTIDGGANWQAFNVDAEVTLGGTYTTIQFKALASTARGNAGVSINTQNLNVVGFADKLASSYVTDELILVAASANGKAYIQSYLPAGTAANPFLSNDNGATWHPGVLAGSRAIGSDPVLGVLFEYEYSVAFGAANTGFRGRLDLQATDPSAQPVVGQASFIVL